MMESPYTPPVLAEFDIPKITRSERFFRVATWVCGAGVVLGPIIGFIGTVKGMVGAFGELEKTDGADPSVLAGDISMALLTTLWGLVHSVILLIPFVVFLVLYRKRKKLLQRISKDPQ
jgi:biopolymer transport protein ExbB/TolQ